MKTTKLILTSLCLIFLCQANIQAQSSHRITLNVNTASISARSVNANANFGQDTESVSNEDYTVSVRIGDQVIWDGISTSSENDRVEIVSINHEGGARLFGKNVINGNDDGMVIDTVVASDGGNSINPGDTEKYTIKFRVVRNGQRLPGIFQIDPKLVIKQ